MSGGDPVGVCIVREREPGRVYLGFRVPACVSGATRSVCLFLSNQQVRGKALGEGPRGHTDNTKLTLTSVKSHCLI
jgi:hypothetical protein